MSAAFDGVYDFHSWDISHEFMVAFMKHGKSTSNKNAQLLEREICETLCNIQNNFHSAVNAFIALERKHDEILGKINSGMDESKVNEHIVRIIVLLKRCICKLKKDITWVLRTKITLESYNLVTKHYIHLDTWGTALIICSNSTKNPGKAVLLIYTYSLLL